MDDSAVITGPWDVWALRAERLPGYTRITGPTLITEQAAALFGAWVTVGATLSGINIRDGRDARSGQNVGNIMGQPDITTVLLFPHPLLLPRGMYVGVLGTLTEATIFWRPLLPDEIEALA